jgi:NAD+ synthase (glutamine-hydrolysing)
VQENIRFVLCQINSHVGDIEYNKTKILEIMKSHSNNRIETVLVFPELSLSGYIPLDQLYYNDLHTKIELALNEIKSQCNSINVIVGAPRRVVLKHKILLYNSAYVMGGGTIKDIIDKTLLPNYDVFHEKRYFLPSEEVKIINLGGAKVGLQICEDMWDDRPEHTIKVTQEQVKMGAEIILNISASPYHWEKPEDRLVVAQNHIHQNENSIVFAYLNLVGSQDEIVFDGRSFLVDPQGELVSANLPYQEEHLIFEYNPKSKTIVLQSKENREYIQSWETEIIGAIRINLIDYLEKNDLKKSVLVALSGGIDSALTTILAVDILGKENVKTVYMPSKFSSNESGNIAKQFADNLGIELFDIPIRDIHTQMIDTIHNNSNVEMEFTVADENIQPRIRSTVLMYLSNKFDALVIATGNKSEIACGYTTIYGDTVGGKNLIGDLYKTEVYHLAEYYNREEEIIPNTILTRAPTAELKLNQKDSDSLPKYEILDQILEMIIEEELTVNEIIGHGFDANTVKSVLKLVRKSEFKRSQICQTVKLKKRTFGIGRLYPVTSGFIP